MSGAPKLREDLDLARELCSAAGEIALRYREAGVRGRAKEDGTPVTPADLAVERALVDSAPLAEKRARRTSGAGRRPMDPDAKARLGALKALRAEASEELGLDAGFLASASLLESIARDRVETMEELLAVDGMTRWRAEAIGPTFLSAGVS